MKLRSGRIGCKHCRRLICPRCASSLHHTTGRASPICPLLLPIHVVATATTCRQVFLLATSGVLEPDLDHPLTQSGLTGNSLQVLTVGVAVHVEIGLQDLVSKKQHFNHFAYDSNLLEEKDHHAAVYGEPLRTAVLPLSK